MPARGTKEGDSQYHIVPFFRHSLFCLACSITTKMPYVFRQGNLPKLDIQVDRGSDFMAWTAQWESYMSLTGLSEESNEKKVQALTLCFTRKTLSIVHNLGPFDVEKKYASAIIATIKKYIDGHINESVEHRCYRRCTQQPGECFDDFLLALHDLVQKNMHDQLITGILDGDTVEDLLQLKDLTLDKAIQVCQAQEAAKKQHTNHDRYTSVSVAAICNPQTQCKKLLGHTTSGYPGTCPGCSGKLHPGGRAQCPAFNLPCNIYGKLGHFAKACHSRHLLSDAKPTSTTSANELSTHTDPLLSNINHVAATHPAPKISINITSLNGSTSVAVLPDSDADISAAGEGILHHLKEHVDNLLPSTIIPKIANRTEMHLMGKLPVNLKLGNKEFAIELHIYPHVGRVLISWKACKSLGILPDCYPHPPVSTNAESSTAFRSPPVNTISVNTATSLLTKNSAITEFPTVFDGVIRATYGWRAISHPLSQTILCHITQIHPLCIL